tara:strand:+ start:5111 stop:6301 length:1191 start_codon:yes stop_codon:yes gene_type:complete
MPDPTASPTSPSKKGEQSTNSGSKGQQQAAEDLKKAGQRVTRSGQEIAQAGGEPSANGQPSTGGQQSDLPQDPLMTESGSGEPDPLIPESEDHSESAIFAESDAEPSAGGEPSAGEPSDPMMAGEPSAGGEPSGGELSGDMTGDPASISDEIRAAQEALQEAGIALQKAGGTLENASTDEEIEAAKEALSNARIAIIIAGQDLISARLKEPELGGSPEMQGIFDEAEDALNDANVAIVIATDSILSSQIELPDLSGVPIEAGRIGELDKELDESLVIFEGEILEARQAIIDSAPPPTSNDTIPGNVVLRRASVGDDDPMSDTEMNPSEVEIQQGRMPEGKEVDVASSSATPIPEDIPSPQGDDIVAQQLREAAIAEADPDLKAKLWEEYKRYKAGL